MIEANVRYRLEFNEKQQEFHLELLNKIDVAEENTNGWKTIYKAGEEFFLLTFIDYVEWRYKDRIIIRSILEREMKSYKFIIGRTRNFPVREGFMKFQNPLS